MMRILVSITLLLGSLQVIAYNDQPDYSPNYDKVKNERWRCRLCPDHVGVKGELSTGAIKVSDSEARFGRDNGLNEDDTSLALNGYVALNRQDDFYASITARHLGLDARRLDANVGKHNQYELSASWREIPRNTWSSAMTPYRGRTELTLPDNWVTGFSTSDLTVLNKSLQPISLGTQRKRLRTGVRLKFQDYWTMSANASRETRKGNRLTSSDFFNLAAEMASPINHETDDLRGKIKYARDHGLLSLEYSRSTFKNAYQALTFQKAYDPFIGETRGRKTLAPNNEATAWVLSGAIRINGVAITGLHQRAEAKQNDSFLPYSINTSITMEPLPSQSLEGKVDSSRTLVTIRGVLTRRASFDIRYHSRERDNNTPILSLLPIIGDAFTLGPETSRSYSFDNDQRKMAFHYRMFSGTRLTVGLHHIERQRTRSEISTNEEGRQWVKITSNTFKGLRISLEYKDSSRDAATLRPITNNNPLTVRYHQAARDRSSLKTHLDYQIPNSPVILSASAGRSQTDYPGSTLGLQKNDDNAWGINVSYRPTETFFISAGQDAQAIDSETYGSLSFAARDWIYLTSDDVRTTTVRLEKNGLLENRLDLAFNYLYSDGAGDYVTSFENETSPFPRLISQHRSVDLKAKYRASAKLAVELRLYQERYRSADWALDGVAVNTIRNLITMGRVSPNYSINLASVSFTYSFD